MRNPSVSLSDGDERDTGQTPPMEAPCRMPRDVGTGKKARLSEKFLIPPVIYKSG